MKIGIVTQPLIANYGGYLQAWALQEQLRKMGHEPQTIDYLPKPISWFPLLCSWGKTVVLRCLCKKRVFAKRQPYERIDVFKRFVQKNMVLTKCIHGYKGILINQYNFDAVIVGSDQVWRPTYNAYLQDMFLSFVKTNKVRKIAYAASFGVDKWELTPELTNECALLAKKLDAISVRERSGITLCKNYLDVDAIEVLDPTLLHTAEDYERLCADIPKETSLFLASYVLDLTPEKQTFIENLAKQKGIKVRMFSAHNEASLSIEEWLSVYRDAAYVVTDSFHGTVFSILFHKPFLSIVNVERGASRFNSLLSKFGLLNCLITSINQEIASNEILWDEIDAILETLRADATTFLTTALSYE